MLQFMRKHAKFFYVFFFLVIISFIFFYIGPIDENTNPVLVEIGEEKIYLDEYWRTYDRLRDYYRQLYGDKFDEKMEEKLDLKNMTLDTLIQERLLLLKAREMGITVTDKELQEAIMNEPAFKRDGVFRRDIYLRILELNRMSPRYYEAIKRRELTLRKINFLVQDTVDISDIDLVGFNDNKEFINTIKNAVLSEKRQKVLEAFVGAIKNEIRVKVHRELIE